MTEEVPLKTAPVDVPSPFAASEVVYPTNATPGANVKFLSFRLTGEPTVWEQGLLNGRDADLIVSAYRLEGWDIKHIQSYGQDPSSLNVMAVLVKDINTAGKARTASKAV